MASNEQSQDVASGTEKATQPAIAGVYGDMNSVHRDSNDPQARPAPSARPDQSTQGGDPVSGSQSGSTPSGYASTSDVASHSASATAEGRVNNDDSSMTPTGSTSADQSPNAKPELISAAQQIRQALDQNEQLSSQDIQVKPQGDKIVLRGSVTSESLKSQAEDLAMRAAQNAEVDSQLEVKQR